MNFELPKALIAQEPAIPRDHARLLIYSRKHQKITDDYFYNLPEYLPDESSLVINTTKVDDCRWLFDNNRIEIFVLEKHDPVTITALVRPGRRFKVGRSIELAEGIRTEVVGINKHGHRRLRLNLPTDDPLLVQYEHVPLPPYIKQNDQLAAEYQTVYATNPGSKAAPTAGLHFTDDLMIKISQSHPIIEVDLQVGLGTFAPLTPDMVRSGKLHREKFTVSKASADNIARARSIVAVGTTSARTLESLPARGCLEPIAYSGQTDIFIQPGHKWQNVDHLVTNFHLPGTSLLEMVASFTGSEAELMRIYNHAIDQKYRFYSFGDAMLIL